MTIFTGKLSFVFLIFWEPPTFILDKETHQTIDYSQKNINKIAQIENKIQNTEYQIDQIFQKKKTFQSKLKEEKRLRETENQQVEDNIKFFKNNFLIMDTDNKIQEIITSSTPESCIELLKNMYETLIKIQKKNKDLEEKNIQINEKLKKNRNSEKELSMMLNTVRKRNKTLADQISKLHVEQRQPKRKI